jgi:zinc/manganese transport system substrate-binding protein
MAKAMAQLDGANAANYIRRGAAFQVRWSQALKIWEAKAVPLRDVPIAVQHDAFPYLENWLGLKRVAVLEPKPGVEPSVSYLATVMEKLKTSPVRMVIRAAYQPDRSSVWLSERAGMPAVSLPFTVGGDAQAGDLFGLYDDTINRLLAALK